MKNHLNHTNGTIEGFELESAQINLPSLVPIFVVDVNVQQLGLVFQLFRRKFAAVLANARKRGSLICSYYQIIMMKKVFVAIT